MAGSRAGAVAQWLADLQRRLPGAVDLAVEEALDALIRDLQAVTPVRSGRMRAGYAIATGGADAWDLLNTAEADDGYPYPVRVFDDPTWSRQYGPLNRTLDAGAALLEQSLDAAITRLVYAV